VSGKVQRAFTPQLATTGEIDLTLRAPGFVERSLSVGFACRLRTLAAAGSGTILTLDSNAALTPPQRLMISSPEGARVEFAALQALGPGANQVTLTQALDSTYPMGSFAQPLPANARIELHRVPTFISGRTLERTGTIVQAAPNVDVWLSKLWRQAPPAGATVQPEPPVPGGVIPPPPWPVPIAAIRPPCYADMAVGLKVEIEDRAPDGATSAKVLLDAVPVGATAVRLSDAVGLNPNDVLAIDADDDGRREIFDVSKIVHAGGPGDWATILLGQPTAYLHARNAIVRRLGAPTAGGSVSLNYAAARGDRAILLDMTGISASHQIRLVNPGPPITHSYHRLALCVAKSDADGFYRLPPLSRAGKIEISASDSGSGAVTNPPVELVPDYTLTDNPLDVVVS
jgi:hypothetical protein